MCHSYSHLSALDCETIIKALHSTHLNTFKGIGVVNYFQVAIIYENV